MKNLTEYINEANDQAIFEGFLSKLKDGIEKVVDNPQKYFDAAKKQMNKLKDEKEYHCLNKVEIDKENGQEAVAKELDNLNNDNDLKVIYNYVKKVLKDKDTIDRDVRKQGLIGSDFSGVDALLKDIQKEFKCEPAKAFAIMQIANAMYLAYKEKKSSRSSSSGYSGGYSSSSRSRGADAFTTCVAASVAAMMAGS